MVAMRNAVMMLVLAGAVCPAGPAAAETKTWVGGEGRWRFGNWDPPGMPGATSEVRINAGTGSAELTVDSGAGQEAFSIRTESTGAGEVNICAYDACPGQMVVYNGILNLGDFDLEYLELEADIINQGWLSFGETDVTGTVHNHENMLFEWSFIEGDLFCYADSTMCVIGESGVEEGDAGGGNFSSQGEVWLQNQMELDVTGTFHNYATGSIMGGGHVETYTAFVNEGYIRSDGHNLGIYCHDGATFTNTGSLSNMAGTTLTVMADSVDHQGTITVLSDGAVNFACDLANPAGGEISLLGGTLSARNITHQADAAFGGFGCVILTGNGASFGTLTNQGVIDLYADNQVVGHLVNQPGATLGIRNGDLTIVGHLTNEGTINAVNAGLYYEGGYSGGGELHFSGAEVKATNGTMILGAGSTLNVTGTGRTDLYADIDCGGTVIVATGATAVFHGDLSGAMESLTIAGGATPTGTIDLADNNLVVEYAGGPNPFADVAAWIASGLRDGPGGYWDGPGIQSSAAATHPQRLAALGVIDNSDPSPKIGGLPDLEGEPVVTASVLVRFTWWGDANLDGVVDSNDYDMIDTNWTLWTQEGKVPVGGFRWAVGDFTYDGVIDSNDYDKIDNAWLFSGGAGLGGGAPVPTPEPATLMLFVAGVAALATRRGRR